MTPRPLPSAVPQVEAKQVLTPTGGYLGPGYTHSLNPYLGCSFGRSLCGAYCYAQHSPWIARGRPWGLYAAKGGAAAAYARDWDRLRRKGERLAIFMSSATDPWLPQERTLEVTRGLLEAMRERPPDALVLQTRSPLALRDLGLVRELAGRFPLLLSVTVESDRARVPGLPPPAATPAARIELLRAFRAAGVRTQAAVSPLLPLEDEAAFARALDPVCERVVLDHWRIGDGSGGRRTLRTALPAALEAAGLAEWNELARFERVVGTFRGVLGAERVLVGQAGFNRGAA